MRETGATDRHSTAGTKCENDTGWIELKALIRTAVHAVSQRATAESLNIRIRPVHRYFCVFMRLRPMVAMSSVFVRATEKY
jgi:hypothetical protein